MDDYAELRRRERALSALRRIHGATKLGRNRAYGLFQIHEGATWSGTSTPTKPTPPLTETSSSSCDEHDTSQSTESKSSGTGVDASSSRTEQQ